MKVVLLPGLDGSGAFVAQFSALLMPDYSVDVIHYPNHLHEYADLLEWLKPELPDEEYMIIAESFSGPLAIMIAALKPPKLTKIFFVATFAKAPRRIPQTSIELMRFLPLKSKLLVQMAQPLVMGKWVNAEFTRAFHAVLSDIPKETIMKRLKAVIKVDVSDQLVSVKLPTYYIAPTQDRLVPSTAAEPFVLAGCQLIHVDGPHFILQANPEGVARAFLNSAPV